MTIKHQQRTVDRPPQTDLELYWALKATFGVTLPWTRVCEGHVSPFEAFAEAFFGRASVSVWWASRGFGGKSYMLSLLALSEAAFLGARATVLGGSGAQSLNVHEHSKDLWYSKNAPRGLLMGDPTKWDTHLNNGGHIRSLMASPTSVRGPHPQRLRMDEIDEMPLSILEAAQGQPMRKTDVDGNVLIETQTVMSSTWQNPDGTFTEIKRRAEALGWPIHAWCYLETGNPHDGWLTPDEVERKRGEIPEAMWAAEYDLQEPNPANRLFSQETVELLFMESLGVFTGDGPHWMAEKPIRGVHYTTGVDWAKERDYTVVVTFADDGEAARCVEWRRIRKVSWTQIAGIAAQQFMRWGGVLVHDNTGVGDVVDDVIREMVPSSWRRKIVPFQMTSGKATSNLFTEYISAIEDSYIQYPRIEVAYNNHRFLTMDQVYGKDHVPDDVVAGAMAWHGRRNKKPTIVFPRSETRISPNYI